MARQIKLGASKTKLIGAQIPADLNVALDAWIEQQPDPKPTRSDVLREALRQFLTPSARSVEPLPDPVRWERGEASPRWR